MERCGDVCRYAARDAEPPRHGSALQHVCEYSCYESISRLVPDDDGSKDARAEEIRGMAQMVGSLVLARAVRRRELAEAILKSGKKTRYLPKASAEIRFSVTEPRSAARTGSGAGRERECHYDEVSEVAGGEKKKKNKT